jgi:hypothetical protein
MSSFPIQVIIVPILGLAFVVYYVFVMRKQQIGKTDDTNAGFRAGALAERLRMTLETGDPMYNLFVPCADAGVNRGAKDNQPVHVDILMRGQREGVPLQLRYLLHTEKKTDHIEGVIRWTTLVECSMTATCKQEFPQFEVTSRSTATGSVERILACPETHSGNPSIDSAFLVATKETAMAALLAKHLGAFAEFKVGGVHIVGDGKTVSFQMRQDKPVMIGYGLYYPEAMASGLVAIARAVGG